MLRLALMALAAALASTAQAAPLQCPHGLVSEGDSDLQVVHQCGEPAQKQILPAAILRDHQANDHAVTVERWVYGPSNGLYQRLRFIDGHLAQISSGKE
ncbi:DUF2845 domain-containing protein [Pseudomonas typographi]|uniref:DUF2845 domain-containing protein n=1 Tax=Pseudomonas typographi TaxID=2715964 RepID=A0ABR7Z876_9PSED|nr:DUF2845 domain-containing protein [Pseudomonas typographi]MBD1553900.1 DUF2845 domain-containing protein [Pseudomonas typographi]MBD1589698.1 DUF2845 domain-containing protein [Pseudomonas typographi]MBD1601735.1 DUF2845 domain-containing protein [Pseudomonas typographi]